MLWECQSEIFESFALLLTNLYSLSFCRTGLLGFLPSCTASRVLQALLGWTGKSKHLAWFANQGSTESNPAGGRQQLQVSRTCCCLLSHFQFFSAADLESIPSSNSSLHLPLVLTWLRWAQHGDFQCLAPWLATAHVWQLLAARGNIWWTAC